MTDHAGGKSFRCKYLDVTYMGANSVLIALGTAVDKNEGLRNRKTTFEDRIALVMNREGARRLADHTGEKGSLWEYKKEPKAVIQALDRYIGYFLQKRLTPGMVEEVLDIIGQECRRWSKDGRLQRSGTASFRRGQVIQISTHSIETVTSLLDDSRIIESWRAQDAAGGPKAAD